MVPGFWNGKDQGNPLPSDGTARDGACLVCGGRFSHIYWVVSGSSKGPYCAAHFPREPDARL